VAQPGFLGVRPILGVYALPEAHRKRMLTTNMLERQNQELKRQAQLVRVMWYSPGSLPQKSPSIQKFGRQLAPPAQNAH
jgi:hypothetical protein